MYGLKEEGNKQPPFEFELEEDLRTNPTFANSMQKNVEKKIQEIKEILRKGESSEEFDKYGAILQGYSALQRVLCRIQATQK